MAETQRITESEPGAMARAEEERQGTTRFGHWVDRLWLVEDGTYLLIGAALVVMALALLGDTGLSFLAQARAGDLKTAALNALNTLLLVMMLVEILHTVGISLRSHVLASEPFLIVALIAAIRRVLVITAEQAYPTVVELEAFRAILLELGLLTMLILALVFCIYLIRRTGAPGAVDWSRRPSKPQTK